MNLKNKALIAFDIAKAKLFRLRMPVLLSWALTYRCNQRCLYCQWPELRVEEVSTDEAKTIIKKLVCLKTRRINLTGGEPLLREDVFERIDEMKKGGIFVCLNSNGVLVPDNIKRLKAVNLLNLSFEGHQDIHDAIRGEGAYKAVMAAIDAAKKAGINVKLTATVNRYNAAGLDDLIKAAYELGVKITFQLVEDFTLGTMAENPLKISTDEAKKALSAIILYKRQPKYRSTITNSFMMLRYLLSDGEDNGLECASGNIVFRITPDGKLFPCAGATFRDLAVSSCYAELKGRSIGQIKAKINSFDYSKAKCKCYCANRLSANLLWNLKPAILKEIFED